jgi:large subunit ribosomal protein L24
MAKWKIRKDDEVKVLAGREKGKTGKVLKVLGDKNQVMVEGINQVTRNVKPQGDQPGGRVEKESSLHISNVALFNAEENRVVKVGWRVEDGKRVRFDKKTGAVVE